MSEPADAADLAAQIRAIVQQARPVPMSSAALVNRPALLALVGRLEDALPTSKAEAARIVVEAEQERSRLVAKTEVHAAAARAADALVEQAQRESAELRREADAYVDTTFAHLQVSLTKTLAALERGRERLAGRSELDSLGSGEGDDSDLPPLPS